MYFNMVDGDGFEPPRPFGKQIYSLPHSTALPTIQKTQYKLLMS